MLKKESSFWLSGLKLIACICIFLDHFDALFYYGASYSFNYSGLYSAFHSTFNMFLNTYFYLTIFYLISGLLAQNKKIESFKDLVKALILRYFRFAIPLLFAAIFAYIISIFPGYYCEEACNLTGNDYFNIFKSNNITLLNVLKCAFLFDSSINPILWTIRCIFYGTCIVYILNYLTRKFSIQVKLLVNIIVAVILFIIADFENVNLFAVSCTILGSTLLLIWNIIGDNLSINKIATGIVIFIFLILNSLYGKMSAFLGRFIHIGNGDIYYMILLYDLIISYWFIFFINYSEQVKNILSSKLIRKASDKSFALYMVHEPIICSLALYIFVTCFNPQKYYILVPSIFIITVFVLIIVVNAYHKTIDKTADIINLKIKKAINSLIP